MNALRASHNKSYKDIIERLEALEKFYELHRLMNILVEIAYVYWYSNVYEFKLDF